MIQAHHKLAIFMEGALGTPFGKMGEGLMRYSPNEITCVIDSRFAGQTVKEAVNKPYRVNIVASVEEAKHLGSDVLVLGIAPSGGKFPDEWEPPIINGLSIGMSLVNGLHDNLKQRFSDYLIIDDQFIWNVREPKPSYKIASAKAAQLQNKRVLLVGTDMAVGKMTTGLELHKQCQLSGVSSAFLATGQVGITITGSGIPLDAIKVDQASGAVEELVLTGSDKDIVFIEGQGSLLHPGSTATLPLMRGSCATHLILCHRATSTTLFTNSSVVIPPLKEFIALNESVATVCGSLTKAICVGIALNTFDMNEEDALEKIKELELETGLPVTDVVRFGSEKLLNSLL